MTTERVVIEITESGARLVSREIDGVSKASDNAAKSTDMLKRALAGLGAAFSVGQLFQIVDGYTALINRLKLVTESTRNLVAINKELFEISNRTFASYSATITLYSRFAFATEKLGISQRRLLGIVESINLAATLSGTGAENQKAGLVQLSQAISSNLLRGDELTSILENVPRVAKVIADGMNVTVGDLKKLGEEGKITASDIVSAFEKSAPKLKAEFDKTIPTVSNGLTVLKNNLTRTLGELDQGSGASRLFASGILSIAGSVETVTRLVLGLAIALGINYAVQGVGVAITATRALTVAMMANPFLSLVKGIVIAIGLLTTFSDKISLGGGSVANLADLAVASFEAIKVVVGSVVNFITSKFPEISTTFNNVFGGFSFTLKDMLLSVARGIDATVGMFSGLRNAIPLTLGSIGPVLELLFNNIFNSILRSATAWYNGLLEMINFINSKLGLGTLDKIQAIQIPLTQKAQSLGNDISKAVAQGIDSEKSAQTALLSIIDRADQIAKARIKASDSDISSVDKSRSVANAVSEAQKQALKQKLDFIKALKDEEAQLGLTKTQMLAYKASQLGILSEAAPTIAAIDAKTKALEREREITEQLRKDEEMVKRITQETLTPLERYNETVAELNRLFELPDGKALSLDVYNRALGKAKEELDNAAEVGKNAFNNLNQYAIQAARNIQSSFANFLFDPFNDGIKGMISGFLNAIRRMVAEIAALKISQSLGLQQMFGGTAGSSSGATSVLSGSGGLGSALNLASLGSGAMNLFKTGFGATSLLSNVGRMLPGSAGSFFGGMGVTAGTQAAAEAGASALWGASGASTAASMGSSFAAAAGPAIALIAVDQIGRLLAGDKKLGGAEMIPVIGGFMAALFGRGPLKQKETNLIGDFTGDGFSGITSTKFKAQGGAFRGSKVDRVMIDTDTGNLLNEYRGLVEGGISKVLDPFAREAAVAAVQLGKYLDDVTTSTAESMQKVGESLGKGKDAMDGFYYTINIASEKGKSLTDEQISEVLGDMADTMARHVIPNIDQFRKAGESAADAALRIGNEFEALVSASAVLGVSLGTARTVLQQSSIEGRTAFIEAAGGIDALNSKAQYFAANFLDGSEIIQRNSELLTEQMGELGLSTDMTKEDFKNLVQSFGQVNGVSEEMLIALLDIAPLFNEVKTAADAAGTSISNLTEKLVLSKDEMIAVGTVLGNVGYSFGSVMQVLRDLPAEEITAFVQKMGGIEGLLSSSGSFADNFLTAEEKLQFKTDYLAKRLTDLGVSSSLTAEQFRDLVMGQGEFANASFETRAGALILASDFFELNGGIITVKDSVNGLNSAAAGASVSVDSLVQAGVDFGLTMQQISKLLNSTSPADLANWAKNNSQINQQADFFKQNFLTPDQQFANDSQNLANQLFKAGIDPNISRSGFTAILQDMTAQNNAAARNLMGLFDSVHDRIEASALAAQNFVAPVAEIINQDAINTAKDRLKDTEGALTQAQNELNQARQAEVNTLQQTVDKYRNYEQAMKNASNALALSAASPLTPMEKYQEANRQLQAAAKSGDYEKLQQAGSAFLEASKLVNASGGQYSSDYAFVKGLYDQAASAAGKQASDAERQLGALGTINNSVLSVAQAVNNLAAAQSAYNAAKSAIPAPVYSTPNVQAPQVLTMPSANFDMSNVIQFPSDTQIRDFVDANYGDWMTVYEAAKQNRVSFSRLSSVTGIPLYEIEKFAKDNNLPFLDRGTDYVGKAGLAMLHKGETVGPSSLPEKVERLISEVIELRKDNEKQAAAIIRITELSNDRNANRITQSNAEISKETKWERKNKVVRK